MASYVGFLRKASESVIKAVTLDFWGTLLHDSPAGDERYKRQRLAGIERILKKAGVKVGPRQLDRAYDESGHRLARIWQRYRDVPVSRHVAELLDALDPELPERLAPDILSELTGAYSSPALLIPPTFDEGANAALGELAGRGFTLCVVSNTMRTPGEVLRKILERYGLLGRFALLTFSDECGIRKPDPEIFRLTLHQVGVAAGEAVHVGDDPVLDVEGAKDAGMQVIQVTASGRATGPAKPDAVITRLGQLPAAVDRLTP